MKKSSVIGVGIAIMAPLALAIGIKSVKGSEPPGRLVANGDGTVTDTVTKLVWQQTTNVGAALSTQASTCASLSLGNLTSGWRLPTIKELVSIVDYESPTSPLIDTAIFNDILTAEYHNYWTSDATAVTGGNPGNVVNFDTGVITNTSAGNGWVARCVHAMPTDGGVP